MKKLSTLTLAALTAVATFSTGAQAASNYSDHIVLGQTIKSVGVDLQFNPKECWRKNAFGWYRGSSSEMVICQVKKQSVGVEAQWTEEDLDTLRHEAQHLIQDCMDGSRQGYLGAVYKDPIGLAKDVLGPVRIQSIINGYAGAPDHVKVMELEAFSVAAMNVPLEQVVDIKNYCL